MKFLSLALLALLFLAALPARADSTSSPVPLGPDGGWISAVALSPSFTLDGDVWVAPLGGHVFASDDHLNTWQEDASGETDPVVTGLAVSPNFPLDRTLYAAADDGVFRSQDGGLTWHNASAGLAGQFVRQVVLSPNFGSDRRLWAGTQGGVYASNDGGASWSALNSAATLSLAVSGVDLFAGPVTGGILESSNGGPWTSLAFPDGHRALAIAPSPNVSQDGTILAGADDGIWLTADGGATWRLVQHGRFSAIALSPNFTADKTAFAGSSSGASLFVSHDGGQTWQPAGSPGMGYIESLAVSPDFASDDTVVAGTAGNGVWASSDGGVSWKGANLGLHAAQVSALAVSSTAVVAAGNGGAFALQAAAWGPLNIGSQFATAASYCGNTLLIGTQDHGLLLSGDGGQTFSPASLPVGAVSALGCGPDGTVLAADGWIYRSTDGGQSWSQAVGMTANDVRRFVFSPSFARDGVVYAATVSQRLYRSEDGGRNWAPAADGLPADQITDVVFAGGQWYAATVGHGIFTSQDGDHWTVLPQQPASLQVTALAQLGDGTLLAGTDHGIFALKGAWSPYLSWDEDVTSLVPTLDGRALLVGTLGNGVWQVTLPSVETPPPPPATATTPLPSSAPPPPPATATPTPTPTSTSTTTLTPAVSPTPATSPARALHPWLAASPNPFCSNLPAVLRLQGPPYGNASLRLSAGRWLWDASLHLPASGSATVNFVPPAATVLIQLTVLKGSRRASVQALVPAVPCPSPG